MVGGFQLLRPGWTAGQIMTTVVGVNGHGYSGDGGPAAQAGLWGPRMVAFDRTGGYYVVDTLHNVIRHVDGAGIITTFAGTGEGGYNGDGINRLEAQLNQPHSIDLDPEGNVIIGDPLNNRVRRIDADTGLISTIAGVGDSGDSGDGGPATAAHLNNPKVALVHPVDGSIIVGDFGNNRIRRIDPDGIITTIIGTGRDGYAGDGGPATEAQLLPRNLLIDPDGNIYVCDRASQTVRRVDATTGIITRVAGNGTTGFSGDGGPATKAALNEPRGLGRDWMGNLYIADSENNRLRRVDTKGIITTVAGTGAPGFENDGGPPTDATITNPRHAIFDEAGNLYITDTYNDRIRLIRGFTPPRPAPSPGPASDPDPAPKDDPMQPRGNGTTAAGRSGYWMVGADGRVYPFGDARSYGDAPMPPDADAPFMEAAADLEPTPTGNGYWVVDSTGRVTARGDAADLGSVDRAHLVAGEAVTALSATPSGNGYWIFTSRGRALALGDAVDYGDMSTVRLNGPVLDAIPTPSGRGYYMVASDGGIFAFGDARFSGSMGNRQLNAPVQSLVPDGDGVGYWLVASDGGIFAFDAPFRGSMGATRLNRPVTGMVPFGNGYLMAGEDGGIFNFSSRSFSGSLGGNPPPAPIVAVAAFTAE
jgi:sugar lactone lactonase YvrE